jgi:hypothetical protein
VSADHMQTDQSHYLDALLKLYLGLPERPSRGRAPPTSALPATFTDGGLRLKPWKRLCCWHPRVVYSAIHLFHRCRRSARSIISSRSSGKSQPARSHRTIFTTFVTSLNPTSPEIGPRTEPTLSPPRHSAQSVIFFHFHVAVNRSIGKSNVFSKFESKKRSVLSDSCRYCS